MSNVMDTREKIAAGLEEAFARHGFTELGVDALRDATKVSLRTLYKHCPSREDMILAALQRRHERYLAHLFDGLPEAPSPALEAVFDRVGAWMAANAPRGCMFHSAVAAHPHNVAIRTMLERHKTEVADRIARATQLSLRRDDLMLLHEGLTQSWPLMGEPAVVRAKALAHMLLQR